MYFWTSSSKYAARNTTVRCRCKIKPQHYGKGQCYFPLKLENMYCVVILLCSQCSQHSHHCHKVCGRRAECFQHGCGLGVEQRHPVGHLVVHFALNVQLWEQTNNTDEKRCQCRRVQLFFHQRSSIPHIFIVQSCSHLSHFIYCRTPNAFGLFLLFDVR